MNRDKGKIRAIFVRHPESTGNEANVVKGTAEYPLDAAGKRESMALGVRIAKFKPSIVITSPLSRAKEAATRIAKKAGVGLRVDKELLPQDFGSITGEKRGTGEPKIRDLALRHPDHKAPGGGESFSEWDAKNTAAMRRVKLRVGRGERPVVVTHSRNLRELGHALFGERVKDPTTGGPEPSGYLTLEGKKKLIMHRSVK